MRHSGSALHSHEAQLFTPARPLTLKGAGPHVRHSGSAFQKSAFFESGVRAPCLHAGRRGAGAWCIPRSAVYLYSVPAPPRPAPPFPAPPRPAYPVAPPRPAYPVAPPWGGDARTGDA